MAGIGDDSEFGAQGALDQVVLASLQSTDEEVTSEWLFADLRRRFNRAMPGVVSNAYLAIIVDDVLQKRNR